MLSLFQYPRYGNVVVLSSLQQILRCVRVFFVELGFEIKKLPIVAHIE